MMKFRIILLLSLLTALPAWAQVAGDDPMAASLSPLPSDSVRRPVAPDSVAADAPLLPAFTPIALSVPTTARPWMAAPGLDGCSPWWSGLYGAAWQLHPGFNAQFSLSASFGLGKHSHGVGFGQSAAFAYALPLNDRLSFAAALYADNMDWGAYHLTDVGVGGVVAYRATDYLNLYGYVTKSFLPRDSRRAGLLYAPWGLYGPYGEDFTTRIGGMAEFKIGESATISVSVEHRH